MDRPSRGDGKGKEPSEDGPAFQPKYDKSRDDGLDEIIRNQIEAKRRIKKKENEQLAKKSYILRKEPEKKITEEDFVGYLDEENKRS